MNTMTNTATRIDGKASAARLLADVKSDVALSIAQGITPGLAVVLIGNDPASEVYVRNKLRRAEECGIRSFEHRLAATTSENELLTLIGKLNQAPHINGILVQLPLPAHIDEQAIISAITPLKDVDGFHRSNVGGLVQGMDVLTPCTPSGCMRLLRETCGELEGLHAVIVGRSNIVGKPMASLLLAADCSVTIIHSRSRNAAELCQQADIVVAAVGRPGLIDAHWIRPGAVVIDVGINRIEHADGTRLVGDVDAESVSRVASAMTPVPGGVGPMTIACLLENTIRATRLQQASANQTITATVAR